MKRLWLLPLLLCLLAEVNHAEVYVVRTKLTAEVSAASATMLGGIEAYYEAMVAAASGVAAASAESKPNKAIIIHTYQDVITGFAASLTPTQVTNLLNTPEVAGVFRDSAHHLTTTHTPQLLGLKETVGLWPETDHGNDTIIGVLDSGVWPESASFVGTGLGPAPPRWRGKCVNGTGWTAENCNEKLIGAWYSYAGYEAYKASVGEPIDWTLDYRSARDSVGHGTHTASTAGGRAVAGVSYFGLANGTAQGMAPKSRLAVYKVCWFRYCMDSDILAGFDRALADGVDIISVSLGSDSLNPFYKDGIAIGSYGAAKRGVFVSAAAGNSGPAFGTVENTAPWVTTVGASTMGRAFHLNVKLGNGDVITGLSLFNGKPLVAGNVPLILASTAASANGNLTAAGLCYPGSLDPAKVMNKIVVCRRGDIGRVEKGAVVANAGGAGMILANTFGLNLEEDQHVLPATMVSAGDGDVIANYISNTSTPTALLLLPTVTALGVTPAPAVAGFSSRGPNLLNRALLKPDLVAPGVRIVAAWPPNAELASLGAPGDPRRSNWELISGTSMACPHVSGVAALLRARHPTWSPAAIRSALMTTASHLDNANAVIAFEETHLPATPNEFGAGTIHPQNAADPGLIYDQSPPGYVQFLCACNLTRAQILTIDADAPPCPAQSLRIEDFNYPSFSAYSFITPAASGGITTTFFRTLTNVGPAASTYISSFAMVPVGWNLSVTPNELVFTAAQKTKNFTLTVTIPAAPVPPSGYSNYGYAFLRWSDQFSHVVQSPIVAYKQTL